MVTMNRRTATLALAGVIAGAAGGFAFADDKQKVTLRFPIEYSLDVTPGLANVEFKKRIEQKSNGRITVELYPNGSLYKGIDLLQAIARGDAEMTNLVSAYWASISPRIGAFDLPYAFPTHEAFYKAADDPELMKIAFSELQSKGVKVLALLPYDYVVPGLRNSDLIKLADFKGKKMRAIGKVNAATLQAFGATPVPINITEVGTSIQQGVIDGLNTPLDVYVSYKWTDIIRHVTYAKYYFAFYPWAINTAFFEKLSPEDQKLIEETAKEVARDHRARARKAADDAMAALKEAGVKVHEQTPDEAHKWKAATTGVWKSVEDQFGPELIDKLRSYAQ